MNRAERRKREAAILAHRSRLRRVERHHELDEISLLVPYDAWTEEGASEAICAMALALGASQVVRNPWPDRLCGPFQLAAAQGLDVTRPCVLAIRYKEEEA